MRVRLGISLLLWPSLLRVSSILATLEPRSRLNQRLVYPNEFINQIVNALLVILLAAPLEVLCEHLLEILVEFFRPLIFRKMFLIILN
jgi:hypothetical protein